MNLPKRCPVWILTNGAKMILAFAVILAAFAVVPAQQIEKLELTLAPPTLNTDRGDGYGFEMRGTVYGKNIMTECGRQPGENRDVKKEGRYLLRVRYNKSDGLIATFAVTLNDKRTIAWESYSKYELGDDSLPLSFAYEGAVLSTGQRVLADFTPQLPDCFGGKLVIYFLNGG